MSSSDNSPQQSISVSNDQYPDVTFPSGELLLTVIQNEYSIEADRKRDLETRSGILIALLGALVGFYISEINFSFLKKIDSSLEIVGGIFLCILYIFPVLMLIISFKYLINVLKTKRYQRIGLEGFNKDTTKKPLDQIASKLMVSYKGVVDTNGQMNDEKAEQFKKGIDYLYVAIIGMVVVFLLKKAILLFL